MGAPPSSEKILDPCLLLYSIMAETKVPQWTRNRHEAVQIVVFIEKTVFAYYFNMFALIEW